MRVKTAFNLFNSKETSESKVSVKLEESALMSGNIQYEMLSNSVSRKFHWESNGIRPTDHLKRELIFLRYVCSSD